LGLLALPKDLLDLMRREVVCLASVWQELGEGSYYYGNKEEQPYIVSALIDLTISRK
jgi:hypothetical protein